MKILTIGEALGGNPYPGRGILLGRSAGGDKAVIAYFIMGRSENSRNRVFEETKDGIRTRAFDESKMTDPSLIIYHPVRQAGRGLVVTNGDQTDTIRDYLLEGRTFAEALRSRTFEPDEPNFTPRISGLVSPDGSYKMSILKSAGGNPAGCQRFFYEYEAPLAGQGHLIHTYRTDGRPIPSFEGEPKTVRLEDEDIDAFTARVWDALDGENRVSLFTRYISLETGEQETRIVNKNA